MKKATQIRYMHQMLFYLKYSNLEQCSNCCVDGIHNVDSAIVTTVKCKRWRKLLIEETKKFNEGIWGNSGKFNNKKAPIYLHYKWILAIMHGTADNKSDLHWQGKKSHHVKKLTTTTKINYRKKPKGEKPPHKETYNNNNKINELQKETKTKQNETN